MDYNRIMINWPLFPVGYIHIIISEINNLHVFWPIRRRSSAHHINDPLKGFVRSALAYIVHRRISEIIAIFRY